MRIAVIAAVVLALPGCNCGSPSSTPDGPGHPDAAIIDAAALDGHLSDATIPTDARLCAIVAPSQNLTPSHTASVAYDVPLADTPGLPAGVRALFVDGLGLAVFRWSSFQRLSLGGVLGTTTPYPVKPSDGAPVDLWDVAQGSTGYGAIVALQSMVSPTIDLRFCVFDAGGATTLASCTPIPTVGAAVPQVTWTGSGFAVFLMRGGVPHVWTFDPTGSSTGEQDLWTSAPADEAFFDAAHTAGSVVTAALGPHAAGSCSTLRGHTIDESLGVASHVMQDWLPTDFRPLFAPALAGDSSGRFGAVYVGKCTLGTPAPCDGLPGTLATVTFVTVAQSEVPVVTQQPVPVPRSSLLHAVWDADRLVVGYDGPGTNELRLSGFDMTGALVINSVLLPLHYRDGGAELLGFHGLVSVGPFDYVVAYSFNSASGPHVHLARVTLMPM